MVQEARPSEPLFLTASFFAPHPPLFPTKKHFEAQTKQKLPPHARGDWVNWKALSPKGIKGGHRVLLEGETLRAAQAGYFGLIDQLDDLIAPLIQEFRARSEKAGRPWVVVVTSDHGEMLGDHGFFRKCEPYEGSANIPFIICGSPSLGFKPGLRVTRPVCLEDIMPTLLALAATKCPTPLDGVDLLPVLRGGKDVIRQWLHFEHAQCYSKAQAYHALTDGRTKYIWRPLDGSEQLFDLEKDPREEHDLSADASHAAVLEAWRARLVKRLADRPEGFSRDGRLVAGRPYPPLNKNAAPAKTKPAARVS
jgi:arylsulfatase A-like enzyme